MYQIKQYAVEIDDKSYLVVGKLSDDREHIEFTVDIAGKEVTLDAKFKYQSKEDFEYDCARMYNGPIFTATIMEWAIIKEFQAEISKLTDGDYWMQYLRHHNTLKEDMPDIINEVIVPDMKYVACAYFAAIAAVAIWIIVSLFV
jgi:hypothetical protein